ncbi:unnamed protein product [Hermetia illucens]|uniref:Uncharacterized protein n=1 Tax=Hermetia illucens TaxID=343691 RepID=A0A7R8V2Q4_HERIL|nr:unnamed protein product [Hermetia illucens]
MDQDTKDMSTPNQVEIQSNHINDVSSHNILLATAIINVKNVHGHFVQLRALTHHGSQNFFVAEKAVKLLGIKREHANVVISGIGSSTRKCYGQILLTV